MYNTNSEDRPAQLNALLADLRAAAHSARNGDSRSSEAALRNVANIPPSAVTQLALAAMSDVVSSFPPQPNSEAEVLGPFLMLVAARLLHGGLARDWDSFWFSRLDQLRNVRASLEGFIKHPALLHQHHEQQQQQQQQRSQWLAPAVNEIAVAWAILSKMMMIASGYQAGGDLLGRTGSSGDISASQVVINYNNNNNNNVSAASNNSAFVTRQALAAVTDEWCSMVASVPSNPDRANVICALLRQAVEECGLIAARSSLGRGMSLECHDSLRESVFDHVLPTFMTVLCETMLQVEQQLMNNNFSSSCCSNGGGGGDSNDNNNDEIKKRKKNLITALTRMTEVLFSMLSWGPSVFSEEFGLDRVPRTLLWPARKFRRCVFFERGNSKQAHGGDGGGATTTTTTPVAEPSRLLLPEAALASFRVAMQHQLETDLAMPALQCLIQLCSVQMSQGSSAGNDESMNQQQQRDEQNNNNNGPETWQPAEAARWVYEMSHSLLSVCGYQIFTNYLPDPRVVMSGGNNLIENEVRIETGGNILRSLAVACGRLTTNAVEAHVLCFHQSIIDFPDNVMVPLREFAVNTIQYAHELAVAVRASSALNSANSQEGGEAQVEEVFAEAIDSLLNAWRDVVRTGLENSECRAKIFDTQLYGCIIACSRSVFETFVNSRINFNSEVSQRQQQNNNKSGNQRGGGGGGGGLVASSIASHGLEWTRSQINTVGLLGRHDARLACELISNHLGPTVGAYLESLNANNNNNNNNSNDGGGPDYFLNESVWYLFEIMAWVITDDETASTEIPTPMVDLALQVEKRALEAEQHNADDPAFWAQVEREVPVFALMRGTFHFCSQLMEFSASVDQQQQQQQQQCSLVRQRVSPMIVTAVLSLFRRYVHAYIIAPAGGQGTEASSSYEGFSRVFSMAFDGGVAAATVILKFLNWSICWYSSDDGAMKEAGELLYALASKPTIGEWIMGDRSRTGVLAAAAAGDDQSNPLLRCQLPGVHRGALAGAMVSACASDTMVDTAMGFLDYYVKGFASPIVPPNFANVAETVASIANLFSHAKCVHHLGTIVNTVHPYLRAVVEVVTDQNATAPADQNYALLSNLLEVFLNGIEICSFNLSTEIIGWMLRSSVKIIYIVGAVVRHSVANVVPRLGSPEARQAEEQHQLRMLKSSTALILCAAQWGNLNFAETMSGNAEPGERENVVGTLCVDGMLLVLREARHTDLIEVPELNAAVFRLLSEVAQTHTPYFLSVSNEDSAVLLDATHWALRSADPQLIKHGFHIIEAITVAQNAAQRMPGLLANFLSSCMEAVVGGTAVEPSILVALSNAVFALGCTLGPDMLCDTFANAVGNQPLLAREGVGADNRYVRLFVDAAREVVWQQGRRQRRMFSPVLRRVVMTVRCANIFT